MRIAGRIRLAVRRRAVDTPVQRIDTSDDAVDAVSVLKGEAIDGVQGVAQAAERIRAIAAVFSDSRRDFRMCHLEQQRAWTTGEQNHDLAVDAPRHRARPEETFDGRARTEDCGLRTELGRHLTRM